MTVLIVVPTFQEAENIPILLRRLRAATSSASVLVVDDGSPDGTADVAEQVGAEVGDVHVMRRQERRGLGVAYSAGFTWALERGYDVIVEMDGDLSHDPADLPSILAPIAHDAADLVIGSRYVPGGTIPSWAFHRRALSRHGNRFASAALGLEIADSTSGYRAYRSAVLRRIGFERIRATGYAFQVEMAYRVVRAGGRVVEVPIHFSERAAGSSKMSGWIVAEALALVTTWYVRDWITGMRIRPGVGVPDGIGAVPITELPRPL
jgi:dolichol-phosphate mannosyltransferase